MTKQIVVAGDSVGVSDRRLSTIEVDLSLANVVRLLDTKRVSVLIRGGYADDEPMRTERTVVVSGIDLQKTISQVVLDEPVVAGIRQALDSSTPAVVRQRGWHLPFIEISEHRIAPVSLLQRASAVRCFRGSDSAIALHADLDAYDEVLRLSKRRVLEHIATPVAERGWKPSHLVGWNFLGA